MSQLTQKNDDEQLDRFFELMRTPVSPDEVIDVPLPVAGWRHR